jgi:hypothetical protein
MPHTTPRSPRLLHIDLPRWELGRGLGKQGDHDKLSLISAEHDQGLGESLIM